MKAYRWFRSTDSATVQRCTDLIDKGFGSRLTYVVFDQHQGGTLYGTPVGRGSEAPADNPGVNMIEGVRQSAIAGTNPNLSALECAELQAFYAQDEDLDQEWFQVSLMG